MFSITSVPLCFAYEFDGIPLNALFHVMDGFGFPVDLQVTSTFVPVKALICVGVTVTDGATDETEAK